MTELEAAVLNEGIGISDGTLEHMEVDTLESVQETIENAVETTNFDKEPSNNVHKVVDIAPDDSNDIAEPSEVNKVQKKRQILIDSDAEDEQHKDTSDKENDKEESIQIKVQKKRITLLDSDSEDEQNVINNEINEHFEAEDSGKENEKPQNKEVPKKKSRLVKMYDSDSNDSTEFRSQMKVSDDIDHAQSSRLKMLCDSDSSADETEQNDNQDKENVYVENIQIKLKPRKSKRNSELDDRKMTGREALEQRRQIKSESQRMVRESRVSLPYHRPKSHTLEEFLQRRSRVGDVIIVPPNTPTTFAIKMSSEQLALTAKRLAEREKEIEEFYKSDTDSEPEDEDKEVESKTDTENSENKVSSNSDENKYVVESTELVKDSDSVVNTEENAENSAEFMDTNDSVNKGATGQTVREEQANNSLENDPTQTVHDEDVIIELIGENHDELPAKVTVNVHEPNEREASNEDDDAAREEKIKELYSVLEKFINNGTDSKAQNNISDNTSDESVKMEINEKENTTEVDSISNNNQMDNSKSDKESLEAKQAAEMKAEQKLKRLNPLVSLKANFQPRLSAGTNDVVVLDDGIEKSKGVNELMKRFLVHTARKTVHKKTDVSIVNVVAGVVHQETINLVDDEKEEERAKTTQTPGAKFKKLREELEEQMARKREEEWKKRQEQKKLDNEEDVVYDGEKTECGTAEPTILFDEEEEMTESESSEEEDEEDDVEIRETPRTKSAFVDDEAEQSDDVEDEEEDDSDEEDDNEEQTDAVKADGVKRPLKRIITAFNDDSDEDMNNIESVAGVQRTTSTTTTTDMFASQAGKPDRWDDDDDITLYQPQNSLEKTPSRNLTQSKPDLSFLTPPLHLTGLQGMPATCNIQDSPVINLSLPPEPSPLRSHPGLKTKLFDDAQPCDFDSNLNELEGLCSGKFTGRPMSELRSNKNLTTEEADLLAVCSGRFTGLTGQVSSEPRSTEENEQSSLGVHVLNDDSQEMKLTFNDDDIMKGTKTQDTSNQTLTIETERDIEERDIEQVSDKKLTESENKIIQECCADTKGTTCEVSLKSIKEISTRPKFVIASSSDEETLADVSSLKKKKLKKKRRKYIIDDISITDDDDFEDREDDFEETEEKYEDVDTRNVGYDSEENEIDLDELEREDNVAKMKKARDFFDAEAELSGSDWGSADEDEKDLDDFEIEDGDMEKINEKKMQQELGKIHARQLLDDDKREVRLLQELLLEDGEMHGTGRERKFRWKNADSMVWNTDDKPKDDDEDCEEIESEFQWRKMRHERETFLKEQQLKMNKSDIDDMDLLGKNSQIMKLGQAALKKSVSGVESHQKQQLLKSAARDVTKSPDVKLPFALVNQRGSFLARSETTLARLAEITQTTNGVLNSGPKKSRNFVFTSVEKPEINSGNTKKRKAEEGTPKILKKLRIADMSPNVSRLKKKLPQKLNMQ